MKLTERQKKNIVSAYADGVSSLQLAKKYGVSDDTIRRIVKKDPNFAELCGSIKKEAEEEAAESLKKAISDRRKFAEDLIDDILQSVKKKVEGAPLRDLMGAAKILCENFVKAGGGSADSEDDKTFTVVICDNGQGD